MSWTKEGGTLVSEGCFGYFNDTGHAIETMQPNRGFWRKYLIVFSLPFIWGQMQIKI